MGKHTPGPWRMIESSTHVTVLGNNNEALFHDDKRIAGTLDDARLISAAPELLEALEAFERISALWLPAEVEEQHAEEMYALHMARNQMLAAIARARGEA